MLQLREKEIFETLKNIKNEEFAVIGGYAANAYTLPRFSQDCDIVIKKRNKILEGSLLGLGYKPEEDNKIKPYKGEFIRFEKKIEKELAVSVDILIKNVFDRQTNAIFSADWVFENSSVRMLKGKTIVEKLELRIINIDALIAMKFISCRNADIRDVFMLLPFAKNREWIKKEISARYDFEDRFKKIKDKVSSLKFKDNLQGVYGYVEETVFERHKRSFLDLGK